MKRLAVFILLLLSSYSANLQACGFYPWGEEVRFCYLKPKYFGFDTGYSYFNYTSDWYDYTDYSIDGDEYDFSFFAGINYHEPNVILWSQYCNGKVDYKSIEQAVYKLNTKDISAKSPNKMLRYLFAVKDKEAIGYLRFAKECEHYTWSNDDPWEKKTINDAKPVISLIQQAGEMAKETKSRQIKRRYLFLKARLIYYYGNRKDIIAIYNTNFKSSSPKDLLYYWMLFFLYTVSGRSGCPKFLCGPGFCQYS